MRPASPRIQAEADDITLVLERAADGTWRVDITDTGVDAPDYDPDNSQAVLYNVTEEQAAAIMALFVCDGMAGLYSIAGPVVDHLPLHLRPIP